jgi:hypothetical protein
MSVHWLLLVLHDESAKVIHVYSMKSNGYMAQLLNSRHCYFVWEKRNKTESKLEKLYHSSKMFLKNSHTFPINSCIVIHF